MSRLHRFSRPDLPDERRRIEESLWIEGTSGLFSEWPWETLGPHFIASGGWRNRCLEERVPHWDFGDLQSSFILIESSEIAVRYLGVRKAIDTWDAFKTSLTQDAEGSLHPRGWLWREESTRRNAEGTAVLPSLRWQGATRNPEWSEKPVNFEERKQIQQAINKDNKAQYTVTKKDERSKAKSWSKATHHLLVQVKSVFRVRKGVLHSFALLGGLEAIWLIQRAGCETSHPGSKAQGAAPEGAGLGEIRKILPRSWSWHPMAYGMSVLRTFRNMLFFRLLQAFFSLNLVEVHTAFVCAAPPGKGSAHCLGCKSLVSICIVTWMSPCVVLSPPGFCPQCILSPE